MQKSNSASVADHDVTAAINSYDLLAGPTLAEKIMAQLAKIRENISVEDLGSGVAADVLARFHIAAAMTTAKAWKAWEHPELAIASAYALLAASAPIAAFSSAIALDIAIFGGSAKELVEANALLWPLGIGSVVYATGMGITKGAKHFVISGLASVACVLAAATITDDTTTAPVANDQKMAANAVNDPHTAAATTPSSSKYLQRIVHTLLPDDLNKDTDTVREKAVVAAAQAELAQKAYDANHDLWKGNPKKGILAFDNDGNKYNDNDGPMLATADKELSQELATAKAAEVSAQANLDVAERNNPAMRYARYIAAIGFGIPLFVSMIVAGHVLSRARKWFDEHKKKASEKQRAKKFVKDLSDPATMRATAVQEASNVLLQFNGIITDAVKDSPAKIGKVEALFSGNNYMRALIIAVDTICGSLTQSVDWKTTAPSLEARMRKMYEAEQWIDKDESEKTAGAAAQVVSIKPAAEAANEAVNEPVAKTDAEAATTVVAEAMTGTDHSARVSPASSASPVSAASPLSSSTEAHPAKPALHVVGDADVAHSATQAPHTDATTAAPTAPPATQTAAAEPAAPKDASASQGASHEADHGANHAAGNADKVDKPDKTAVAAAPTTHHSTTEAPDHQASQDNAPLHTPSTSTQSAPTAEAPRAGSAGLEGATGYSGKRIIIEIKDGKDGGDDISMQHEPIKPIKGPSGNGNGNSNTPK